MKKSLFGILTVAVAVLMFSASLVSTVSIANAYSYSGNISVVKNMTRSNMTKNSKKKGSGGNAKSKLNKMGAGCL